MPQQNVTVFVSNLPKNSIIMYHGDPQALPSEWAVCDGLNGTPDLRNLFIVGAGDQYGLKDRGGEACVNLTVENIPIHSHLVKYQAGRGGAGWAKSNMTGSYYTNCSAALREETTDGSGETQKAGGGQSHENRPPYYALYYIMKIN